jgi:hypothetical protein
MVLDGWWLTEVQTEMVDALCHKLVDGVEVVPREFFPIYTGEVLLAELSTRLVDAEPFQLLGCVLCSG